MDNALHPILLAEDDENDVLILKRALKKAEISNPIHVVSNGEEVIAYLRAEGKYSNRQQFPFPRFLITDLKMPKMSGMEVLKWLNAHPECSVIPVIVLTSSKEEKDIVEAFRLGANSYMVKPANFDDWLQMVKTTFEFWCRWSEKPKMPEKC